MKQIIVGFVGGICALVALTLIALTIALNVTDWPQTDHNVHNRTMAMLVFALEYYT